jgi:threonine dehydrogenase-like Zn-dependent dehydrogenase
MDTGMPLTVAVPDSVRTADQPSGTVVIVGAGPAATSACASLS